MTRPNQEGTVQAEPRDRVGRGKLPPRKDRLDDFETVCNPVDVGQQCSFVHARSWRGGKLENDLRLDSWLSETHQGERIADRGEVVFRAIVNISPDRFMYVVFSPNRSVGESNLSSYGHLAARHAHLSYCSGYAVCVAEIEGRKARRKWRDLVADIEGG